VPSNLRIVDYSHGMTGSAHDTAAFEHTGAAKHPDWLFEGNKFSWADSAYTVNSCTIPIHKQPASFDPKNALFDKVVSGLHVHSEHCMGALKGQFQCLHGLRVTINNNQDHVDASRWITVAIILHNLIIDVEGHEHTERFLGRHGAQEEEEDHGPHHPPLFEVENGDTNTRREQLIDELVAFKNT
jgi:hypothetical protein